MSNHPNRQPLAYACYWVSARGFANEGTYYYGTLDACRAARGDATNYHLVSKHRTLDAAQASAEREVRIVGRGAAWGEQNYTSAQAV